MSVLQIGGVSCRQLAEEFGTPLIIYDETKIRLQARAAREHFVSERFATDVAYASKAFSAMAVYKLLAAEGMCFDVVSGGELYCANRAGVDMSRIYFHGNNKSDDEINMALDMGIGYFVIDNTMEAERLVKLAAAKKVHTKALLRINPGISAHTHEYIMTATPDSKFGIHIGDREHIKQVIRVTDDSEYVDLKGFHSHIGSQIVEISSFEKAIETMIGFLKEMKEEFGLDNRELSIGGGFGIKYVDGDRPMPMSQMCRALVRKAERCLDEMNLEISKLIMEPGRVMVGEAGHTLYTVGDMKKSGDKNYVFVDGGMSDNIRHALYEAPYTAEIADKQAQAPVGEFCIAGKNCESGDILVEKAQLPQPEAGDLLLIYSTGAYGYSMASNYNRLGRPAVVFAGNGRARLVIKRETYEDQLELEIGGDDN